MNVPADRATLAMPSFDEDGLDDFAPRSPAPEIAPEPAPAPAAPARASAQSARTRREIDAVSRFPSRDVARDGQMNLKGPIEILDRFRAMCKADRRAYYDMLEILMDQFEGKTPKG